MGGEKGIRDRVNLYKFMTLKSSMTWSNSGKEKTTKSLSFLDSIKKNSSRKKRISNEIEHVARKHANEKSK